MVVLRHKTGITFEDSLKTLKVQVQGFEIPFQILQLILLLGMIVTIVKNVWFYTTRLFVFFTKLVAEACVCVYLLVLFAALNADGKTALSQMKALLNHDHI